MGLLINIGVMYAAINFSSREWSHAPLVERNLPWIFCIGIIGFITGHIALAVEVGPSLAYSWGAVICQLLLSAFSLSGVVLHGGIWELTLDVLATIFCVAQ
ncbi:uncharacterized protein N7496_009639 [Penicillium cataractarum]|uniref:Uncharacterized protein n=1 Tax=Penicillium cataractarum TaxID=2100454 RepID=A0A9W9V2M7_9EURO|nr:uncharacterized protein N7496_009639 [Penicillium cataractarum]KAJ5363926.1 hypothetical protein N7496_009639 [Penicillium cataractarum]